MAIFMEWLMAAAAIATVTSQAPAAAVEVLVTGATGGTGAALYNQLKARGVGVRAFVRNATKAREVLGCDKCDASEGIFLGDITADDPLAEAAKGATALAIVTSSVAICPHLGPIPVPMACHFAEGQYPIDVDFHAAKSQLASFVKANDGKAGPVVLCSSMGSTQPDGFLDKLGNGHLMFYKLNFETVLASSGLPFTIVKPCGLVDSPAGQKELLVGHEDELRVMPPTVSRGDVARVMAEALLQPEAAVGLRFDLCSRVGPATADFGRLFAAARYPWLQPASAAGAEELLV